MPPAALTPPATEPPTPPMSPPPEERAPQFGSERGIRLRCRYGLNRRVQGNFAAVLENGFVENEGQHGSCAGVGLAGGRLVQRLGLGHVAEQFRAVLGAGAI